MGCLSRCFSKLVLFILNFIVFAIGTAVIVVASLVLAHSSDFSTFLHGGAVTVPVILLCCGVFVMLLGFFGCFGALKQSPCLLNTYAIIVLVLVMAQIGVGVYAGVERVSIKDTVSDGMIQIFDQYVGGTDVQKMDELSKAIDASQHSLKCCGVFGYSDWYNKSVISLHTPLQDVDVSVGCCIHADAIPKCAMGINGAAESDVEQKIYTDGCFKKYDDLVEGKSLWLIIGAVVLALVQLGCVFIACGLARTRRRDSQY